MKCPACAIDKNQTRTFIGLPRQLSYEESWSSFILGGAETNRVLYALNVSASQPFDLTAEFEETLDFVVIEDSETINHCDGMPRHLNNGFGTEGEVRLVTYREDHCICIFQGSGHIGLDPQFS